MLRLRSQCRRRCERWRQSEVDLHQRRHNIARLDLPGQSTDLLDDVGSQRETLLFHLLGRLQCAVRGDRLVPVNCVLEVGRVVAVVKSEGRVRGVIASVDVRVSEEIRAIVHVVAMHRLFESARIVGDGTAGCDRVGSATEIAQIHHVSAAERLVDEISRHVVERCVSLDDATRHAELDEPLVGHHLPHPASLSLHVDGVGRLPEPTRSADVPIADEDHLLRGGSPGRGNRVVESVELHMERGVLFDLGLLNRGDEELSTREHLG